MKKFILPLLVALMGNATASLAARPNLADASSEPVAKVSVEGCFATPDFPIHIPLQNFRGETADFGSTSGLVPASASAARECHELRTYEKRVCHDQLLSELKQNPDRAAAKSDECELNYTQRWSLCRAVLGRVKIALQQYEAWMVKWGSCDHPLSPRLPPTRVKLRKADADFAAADAALDQDRLLYQQAIARRPPNAVTLDPIETTPSDPFTDGPPEI